MKYRSGVLAFLVFLLSCICSYSGQGGEEVRIRLVDGLTGEAIADAEVVFDRSIAIPCIRPPCPTIERKWVRRTDSEGVVTVPTAEILQSKRTKTPQWEGTAILVPGYMPRDYVETEVQTGSVQQAVLELDPKGESEKGNYRLKILDAKTRKPLSNRRVWLTRPPRANIWLHRTPDCLPSKCPEYWVREETNRLGNIYYSPKALPLYWIHVEGYKIVRPSKNWPYIGRIFLEKSD